MISQFFFPLIRSLNYFQNENASRVQMITGVTLGPPASAKHFVIGNVLSVAMTRRHLTPSNGQWR